MKTCADCGQCDISNSEWWCILYGEDVTGNQACDEFIEN